MAYEINFCETKEQLKHLGEVVTGKTDGSPTGADIDTSTLSYTGQIRKTLPAIEAEANLVFSLANGTPRGDYVGGVSQYDSYSDYYTYDNAGTIQQWAVKDNVPLPYLTTEVDPNNDPNLVLRGDASQSYVQNYVEQEINKAKKVFQSVSDAITNNDILVGDDVETRFFNAKIVQKWKAVALDPSPEFGVLLNNGLWLEEVSNVKYFESFGAYGNGTDLDDSAFSFAKSYNGFVEGLPKSTYRVSAQHDLTNGAHWDGKWSKIILQGNNKFSVVNSNCKLENFDIDGLDEDHTAYTVEIATPSENAQIGDMIYRNFHGKTSTQTYPLKIPAYGAKNFTVGNQKFFNILQDDDGAVTGKGFVGGVYLLGLNAEVANGRSNGTIGDIYGEVIKSVDAGSGVVQDSDLVRLFAETEELTEEFDIEFGNITGRNVYKRIVKASYFPGVRFGDVRSFNPDDGVESYTLFAAVETVGNARNFKFGKIEVEGPSDRVINVKGNGHQFGDIYDGAGCQAVVLGDGITEAISCQIGNVLGRGNELGSSQGIGVRFINANLCNIGDITGRFAVSAQTEETNVGKSTINNITCAGRIALLHGGVAVNGINTDITNESLGGSHIAIGKNARIGTSEIITDGRVTVSVGGSGIDVDIGRMRIVRVTSSNGSESSHSVFTTASAIDGILRGELEIEVNSSVSGTPSGSSGKTLCYLTGLNIDNFGLSMNVTASTRGATGFNYWLNGVNGQANRIAVKSAMSLVGSKLDGKLGVSKLENLVSGGSTVNCSGEVNIGFTEKEAASIISGANFNPNVVNSTR